MSREHADPTADVSHKSELYSLDDILETVREKDPDQPEFIQAVTEVARDVEEFYAENKHYYR